MYLITFSDYSFCYMSISEIHLQFIYLRKKYTCVGVNYTKRQSSAMPPSPRNFHTQRSIYKKDFLKSNHTMTLFHILKMSVYLWKVSVNNFFHQYFRRYREIQSLDFIYVFSPALLFPVCLFSFESQSMNFTIPI